MSYRSLLGVLAFSAAYWHFYVQRRSIYGFRILTVPTICIVTPIVATHFGAFQDNVAAMEGLGTDLRTTGGLFFGIGALMTTGLVILRMLYWWWPPAPHLGTRLSASWTLIVFWFPVLIAWGYQNPAPTL